MFPFRNTQLFYNTQVNHTSADYMNILLILRTASTRSLMGIVSISTKKTAYWLANFSPQQRLMTYNLLPTVESTLIAGGRYIRQQRDAPCFT